MPKRKCPTVLGPSKRKYVTYSKAVKNEIREMICAGASKVEVEAKMIKEKKITGEINRTQWERLSATRDKPEEILATQQFRTRQNQALDGYRKKCVEVFRQKSQKAALGIDSLTIVCQQVRVF